MKPTTSPSACIAAIEAPQRPNRGGFDALTIEALLNWFHVPGMGIAVIDDFQIHWAKGYGIADVESGVEVNSETLFQAGSISKPVTAMALLKMAQEGLLSLDEDINHVLRSWKLPDSPLTHDVCVTPRMLASHTAGLGDGFGFPGYHPDDPIPNTIEILDGHPPSNTGPVLMERQPLQAFKYSGGGTTVLQLALTDLLQRPFAEILQEKVLGPIGMSDSVFQQPLSPALHPRAARAHDEKGRSQGAKWLVHPELAAAGLWTTPTDLAKFAIEVQLSVHGRSNRVLSRSTVQEMLNPVGLGEYAVGFMVERQGEGWYMRHRGGTWGYSCLLLAHKLKGYGMAVMTNASTLGYPAGIIGEIKQRIERVYGWDSLDKPVPR
jgi:CubicO group peptidase (beta-lactamase class C family)